MIMAVGESRAGGNARMYTQLEIPVHTVCGVGSCNEGMSVSGKIYRKRMAAKTESIRSSVTGLVTDAV